jgi:hypothetical protein
VSAETRGSGSAISEFLNPPLHVVGYERRKEVNACIKFALGGAEYDLRKG